MATIPSISLIPSGYKAGKVYSVLPTDGSADFDFSRNTTATRTNKDGLIEAVTGNTPRLDYPLINGVVNGCPSLLLEPQRTNNLVQSNQFNTSWGVPNVITLNGNQLSSLSGGLDAWKLESDGTSAFSAINQSASVTGTNTFSIYAKAGTNRYVSLRGLGGLDVRAQFDLINGEVYGSSNAVSTKINHIKDGWYRCTVTFDASNSLFYIYPMIQGVADAGSIYIQYSQLEAGSYASSYIPTSASAQTRLAETANNAGDASTFNDSEGVLMLETSPLDSESTNKMITTSNGSSSTRILIRYVGTTLLAQLRISGANQYEFSYNPTDIKDNFKIALKYKANDFSFFVNGFELDSSNSGSTFSDGTLTELAFDDGSGSSPFYGNTKQLQYYKTALTDLELETLTSYTSFNAMALALNYTIQ